MPKSTFFNLPEEKRDRIIAAAIGEMGSRPFAELRVSAIVEQADIPRGSFYQYFTELKDLYRYVLQTIGDKKAQYLTTAITSWETWEVGEILRELYVTGLRFAAENPRLAAVGQYFWREDASLQRELLPQADQVRDFFIPLLKRGQERGEVDPQVDVQVASRILYSLTSQVTQWYLEDHEQAIDQLVAAPEPYLCLVDKMLYIVTRGLLNRPCPSTAEDRRGPHDQ